MKQTSIDTSMLPNVWLTWETTKDTFWLDCKTGEKQNKKPDVEFKSRYARITDNVYMNSGSRPYYAYAKYHEDIDMLEMAAVTLPTTRKEEPKEWEYAGDIFFLTKDKILYNYNGIPQTSYINLYRNHCAYNLKDFFATYARLNCMPGVIDEFKKFLGSDSYTIGNGKSVDIKYSWHIQEWFNKKTTGKIKGKGKESKLVDKLTSIPLSDTSFFAEKYPVKELDTSTQYYKEYVTGLVYFERLSDGWSVLRMFDRPVNGNLTERERMYIHDDGANRMAAPYNGVWMPSSQHTSWNCGNYYFPNKHYAIEQCKRIKYVLPVVEDMENTRQFVNCLISSLRFPEIEQFAKLGYNDFARQIAKSTTQKADMTRHFGGYYNAKNKNLLKKVGLTKYQFDKHMSRHGGYYYSSGCVLSEMREFFGDDFAHLDNATFDKYYDAFDAMNNLSYSGNNFKARCNNLDLDYKKFIKNMVRLSANHPNIYQIVMDVMTTYRYLNAGTEPAINWYFDSYSDVVRTHDALIALRTQQDAERRSYWDKSAAERMRLEEEKRKKTDKDRKQYEYEDDNFIIRLPKDGAEITNEGIKQRICIGGYVSRHSLGQTNLFFIRKKSEPDTPFYAIEMSNQKNVIQIHGYCNKWLGNDPEVIPTVVRWLRKNNIKCDEKILTCMATGYGSIDRHCKMPVVD